MSSTPITSLSLSRRHLTRAVAGGAALTALALTFRHRTTSARSGQGATPVPEGATVVAEGLANPRHLVVAEDGTISLTLAGVGGDGLLGRGYSAQVVRIEADGSATELASGLVSYAEGVGASGIVLDATGQSLYFAIGGVAVDREQQPLPEENTVNRIDLRSGEVSAVARLGEYEVANNPDGADISTNLYGMARRTDGSLVIADAGANLVYRLDPQGGAFELMQVIPDVATLSGRTLAADERPRQAVPTAVAVSVDDTVYVSLLSQRWPADGPSIVTLATDGAITPVLRGASMVVSLAFGPDGSLYYGQLLDTYSSQSTIGSVRRVLPDGRSEPVIEGLEMPHGIAFDPAGNLLVVTNALGSTAEQAIGRIIRIDGVAAASGS